MTVIVGGQQGQHDEHRSPLPSSFPLHSVTFLAIIVPSLYIPPFPLPPPLCYSPMRIERIPPPLPRWRRSGKRSCKKCTAWAPSQSQKAFSAHLRITKCADSLLIRLDCILISHDCRPRNLDLSSRLCWLLIAFKTTGSQHSIRTRQVTS